jgi:hypothetical protein
MEGAALSKFNKSAQVHGAEALGHYEETMGDLAFYVLPTRALQVQEHYMHDYMRKSPYMQMKEYMVQVKELSNYLKMFPGYQQGMELQNSELLDIYKFRIPVLLWQKQFLLQNWNPQHHSK